MLCIKECLLREKVTGVRQSTIPKLRTIRFTVDLIYIYLYLIIIFPVIFRSFDTRHIIRPTYNVQFNIKYEI